MTFQQRILNGQYDFNRNVLKLEVSTTQVGDTDVVTEWREYDITSLKVTRRNRDGGMSEIEVLGARTDASMQKILPQLIETFKQMQPEALQQLLSRSTTTLSPLKKRVSLRTETVEDIQTFNRLRQAGQAIEVAPEKTVANVSISNTTLVQNEMGHLLPQTHTLDSTRIENPTVVKEILKASNWEQMIQEVEGYTRENEEPVSPTGPDHAWTQKPHAAILKNSHQDLSAVLDFFHDNADFLKEATARYKNHVEAHSEAVSHQHDALVGLENELVHQLQDYQSYSRDIRDREHVEAIRREMLDIKQEILKLKAKRQNFMFFAGRHLPNLYREVSIILALRELNRQKLVDFGRAPLGSDITHDWDKLVFDFGLVPTGETSLEEHLRRQFGMNIEPLDGDDVNSLVERFNEVIAFARRGPASTAAVESADDSASEASLHGGYATAEEDVGEENRGEQMPITYGAAEWSRAAAEEAVRVRSQMRDRNVRFADQNEDSSNEHEVNLEENTLGQIDIELTENRPAFVEPVVATGGSAADAATEESSLNRSNIKLHVLPPEDADDVHNYVLGDEARDPRGETPAPGVNIDVFVDAVNDEEDLLSEFVQVSTGTEERDLAAVDVLEEPSDEGFLSGSVEVPVRVDRDSAIADGTEEGDAVLEETTDTIYYHGTTLPSELEDQAVGDDFTAIVEPGNPIAEDELVGEAAPAPAEPIAAESDDLSDAERLALEKAAMLEQRKIDSQALWRALQDEGESLEALEKNSILQAVLKV